MYTISDTNYNQLHRHKFINWYCVYAYFILVLNQIQSQIGSCWSDQDNSSLSSDSDINPTLPSS